MYCRKCGKHVNDNSRFCQYCGIEFIEIKEDKNEKIISKTQSRKKVSNKNACISLLFAGLSIVASFLPFQLGAWVLVAIYVTAILSLFFRTKGKKEMHDIYDKTGLIAGKRFLNTSLGISIFTLLCGCISISNFL